MVLSMIQGIALNIGVLPFSKGRALQVRTNIAIKILRMKDVCFIQEVGF
jgi:hypothetical protein